MAIIYFYALFVKRVFRPEKRFEEQVYQFEWEQKYVSKYRKDKRADPYCQFDH